jgi:hypothetical protein
MREELLAKYPGKWVAVHKGCVVAVGDDPLSIMEGALADDGYAYTNKVGEEDRIVVRQRRVRARTSKAACSTSSILSGFISQCITVFQMVNPRIYKLRITDYAPRFTLSAKALS